MTVAANGTAIETISNTSEQHCKVEGIKDAVVREPATARVVEQPPVCVSVRVEEWTSILAPGVMM
eukprot:5008841-Amphidinium_carterae.1